MLSSYGPARESVKFTLNLPFTILQFAVRPIDPSPGSAPESILVSMMRWLRVSTAAASREAAGPNSWRNRLAADRIVRSGGTHAPTDFTLPSMLV